MEIVKEGSIKTFNDFDIPVALAKKLEELLFVTPTDIQKQAIPLALQKLDILASSRTGSGKTLTFLIPLVSRLLTNTEIGGLVIAPTREIAVQINKVLRDLTGEHSSIKSALLIGGQPIDRQIDQLKKNPRVIIGTPGRINDHINRKRLKLDKIDIVVLDEADRMLDMGFDVQIKAIFDFIPASAQKMMFSATMPQKIKNLSNQYLKNTSFVGLENIEQNYDLLRLIKQDFKKSNGFGDKYSNLHNELQNRSGTVVIFVRTKLSVEDLAEALKNDNHSVNFIHGDLKQNVRARIIKDFREQKYKILVATDVVARGLDVPHVEHVVNFDMPTSFDEYIHRIGRTNRTSGTDGTILNFMSNNDSEIIYEIAKKFGYTELETEYRKNHKSSGSSNGGRKSGNRRSGGGYGSSGGGFRKKAYGNAYRNGNSNSNGRDYGNSNSYGNSSSYGEKKPFNNDRSSFKGGGFKKKSFGNRDKKSYNNYD